MSLEWRTVELKSIANVIMGQSPKSEFYNDNFEGMPFLQGNKTFGDKYPSFELYTTSIKKVAEKNSVLMSVRAPVGDLNIAQEDICIGRGVCGLQMKKGDNEFLYYLLKANISHLINKESGTVFGSINKNDIETFEITLPESHENQMKILSILKNIDKKIEVCKNLNKNLDDILDSIFKENFIKEFDNDNNDWKIKNIGELPLIITDYVANGSFASLKENVTILDYEEYAYFIRNTDLKSKSFQKFVNKHSYDFLKKSSLFGNEVIISNVGDVGSVFLCPFLDKPMTLGNNMILVKSRDDAINLNFYLFLLFRSNYGQYLISTITAGSVQSKFNKTEFKSLELTMPNDELIIKFNNLVSPIFDYKNKISDEIVRLTKLRDTLLPKLMSGEIDVSEVNCDLKIIIRKIYIKSSKLFLWRYLSENQNHIKNTKSNETLLKSRAIHKINKFLAKFNARYRYYRQ